MNKLKLRQLLEQFFIEDIGEQDLTSDLIFRENTQGNIVFIAKEDGVFCGEEIIESGFSLLNAEIKTDIFLKDGEFFENGQRIAAASGKISDLLKGERVILNLVQRLSGIATLTRMAVDSLNSKKTKICDTRKTTPGLRMMEKYAVRCGGGFNHRYGLYDGVMIKDNHIAFAGSITKAVESVRKQLGHMIKVEVEIETIEQLFEAIKAKADVIMFDNRTPKEIAEWINLVPDTIITEASGGINLDQLESYGKTGIDYISLGILTHSSRALDISVKVSWDSEVGAE
ncbi:carboxylating nicotinate-nucleotide diphosphorylase [Neobacillus sp. PS3-34]|uniref:carboxylating nicotinate-nucleotide diphosphorylase n=1 Tax=Neobacillus sp. PS3-34 TaxID=3070678 RepID=UPI0027DF60FB|nr:carboxylating nicotinate-nucleotide diphosphorylase [Neobacillus sp. PS3-34]WML47401.1 carboxylating nicotinate-nucleotide diphosphorylase [Neobacillus sp. PS3-34]